VVAVAYCFIAYNGLKWCRCLAACQWISAAKVVFTLSRAAITCISTATSPTSKHSAYVSLLAAVHSLTLIYLTVRVSVPTVLITFSVISCNKKVQQSWQTSALAMHLSLSRLVSMPVIFCLRPSSSIVILVFYLFSTDIREQHEWELWVWVWIQFTGLTLPLWLTPVNNIITLISPVQWGTTFFATDSLCVAL